MRRTFNLLGLMLIAGFPGACGRSGPPAQQSHESLSSLHQLRAAFNADSGKVRAIFLASPT
jgi:hypothetical protein